MSSEELKRYTAIIDGILATADLSTISRKKIRHGLETSLGGKDLSEQKVSTPILMLHPVDSSPRLRLTNLAARLPSRT